MPLVPPSQQPFLYIPVTTIPLYKSFCFSLSFHGRRAAPYSSSPRWVPRCQCSSFCESLTFWYISLSRSLYLLISIQLIAPLTPVYTFPIKSYQYCRCVYVPVLYYVEKFAFLNFVLCFSRTIFLILYAYCFFQKKRKETRIYVLNMILGHP